MSQQEPAESREPMLPDLSDSAGAPQLCALPEPVRQRVVQLAALAMTSMPAAEVPTALRRVAKFAPNRRAQLGGALIGSQLELDTLFRQRIATRITDLGLANLQPDRADPILNAAEQIESAALAYLQRQSGWLEVITHTATELELAATAVQTVDHLAELELRLARTEHERAVAKIEAEKARDELARARTEADSLRDELRGLAKALREAGARERKAAELLATERGRASRALADADAELRRLRTRLTDAELATTDSRALAKEARAMDEARLWLLLETIGGAAQGLRRELALEPASRHPADFVADSVAERSGAQTAVAGARALDADDPARLDQLLALPRVHLVVDGYNVTKRGYADVALEQQRSRLVSGLGGLAAQSGAEVTVVFDGAQRMVAAGAAPRGVRVLFSPQGQTADELIRQLVRAEPAGRPVVVISSDREVADGVRRHGAYPLSADTMLRRLARG